MVTQQEPMTLLAAVEPSQDSHIALDRTIITSELREVKPKLHLFIGVDEENTDLNARNQNLYRSGDWLDEILAKVKNAGVECTYELCWSTDWAQAMLNVSDRVDPFTIFIPDYETDFRRSLFTNSKWELLRRASAPVLIVRPSATGRRKRILAAVNMQKERDNPEYADLNQKIIERGKRVAALYGAEFYVVNAYNGSMDYPNREKIIKMSGLPSQNVHAGEGDPADVIADYANEIGADLVIIGTMRRSGARALMRGNTSEKVLRKVKQDVLTYS